MAISSDGKIVKPTKRTKSEKVPASPPRSKCCGGKQEEDQEEAVTPPENKPEKRRLQGIIIDGITYACAACRAGHRVGVCKHARDRPMRATHPPGRPASGATKKIVCDCPKNCSCARKGCRCPRNCSCTQQMYLLVYVPGARDADEPQKDEENGSWKLGKQVITDLKGNLLTDEEVEKRQQQKLAQRAEKEATKTLPTTPAVPEGKILLQTSTPKAEPRHCCKASQPPAAVPPEPPTPSQLVNTPPRPKSTQGCFCGTACSCAFCPQHPNNHTSQNLARQQALLFSQQQQQQAQANPSQFMHMAPNANTLQINSCVGQQPMFAMSSFPMRPTPASFQQAFPMAAPGYMLAYPMRGFSRPVPSTPLESRMDNIHVNTAQSAPSLADPSVVDPSQDFDMFFDIGDAFVASDGPDGWHQLSHEGDSQLEFPTISPPPDFDPISWNVDLNGPPAANINLSSPPILPQIEPNFLDPTPSMGSAPTSRPACPSCSTRPQIPAASTHMAHDTTMQQLYVSPGSYISPPALQVGSIHDNLDDSWRLQAL